MEQSTPTAASAALVRSQYDVRLSPAMLVDLRRCVTAAQRNLSLHGAVAPWVRPAHNLTRHPAVGQEQHAVRSEREGRGGREP